jgi:DNA-binding HxlR family transcriptional regulator
MVAVGAECGRLGRAGFDWAVNVLGDRCTLLVLYEINAGTQRFNDIQRNIGMPRDRLALRLRRLQAQAVVCRHQYCDHPPRYEYGLTEAGRSLAATLAALELWGTRYRPGDVSR